MDIKLRLTALVLLLAVCCPAYSQICDCVTTGNCPVPINDNGTYNGTLDVTVNGANDLGVNPITSVCFTITHTWIGDLSVALTSPSGVNYLLMADINNNYGGCGMQEDNIDVCIVLGDTSPLTNNTEYICNPGPCPAGVCCLTSNWTVACGGVTDPVNGALQAPNCDLNDFNVPGDPANGTWTLTVVDVCNMDTGTLDNFSLTFANGIETCIVCSADGGALDSMEVTACYGSSDLLLDIPPNYNGAPPDSTYGYNYVISQNGVVLEIDSLADLTAQPPGTYQVHGISYLLTDSTDLNGLLGMDTATVQQQLTSTTSPFCGDLSTNWITVNIIPQPALTVLDTTICSGACVTVGAQQVCASGTVTLTSSLGCDSLVEVNLTIVPPDTTYVTETVCEGGCVDIGGSQYCAPGQYTITLTNALGCDSIVDLSFNEIIINAVINPANPPSLTCNANAVTLDGSGSVGNSFAWSGPNGFTSDQPTVTATEPGIYTLTVSDNSAAPICQGSVSVTVGDATLPPDLVLSGAPPQICGGETFDLASLAITDQNNTNPSITFHSGTPATPANELGSTIVSPASTTTYYILGTTGFCTDEISATITVSTTPTVDFTIDPIICAGEFITVEYTGNATSGADFNWDFDGGIVDPGYGIGPHQLTWALEGTYTVELTVEENGCASSSLSQTVVVEEPLVPPPVTCSPTTSSIKFTWSDVPGASGYIINVIDNPTGVVGTQGNTPNSQVFDGLSPGDSITIEIIAISSNTCSNSSTILTCFAEDCSNIIIDFEPVQDICLEATTAPFNLVANASGGNGAGSYFWTGSGVVDSNGVFDPHAAAIGANQVTALFQANNCFYSNSFNINVFEMPEIAMILPTDVCEGNAATILFDGTADPGSIYTWDFGSGNILSGSGAGPFEVSWATSGSHDISLFIESPDGCITETVIDSIDIAAPMPQPVITCEATMSSVVFGWGEVQGAANYSVNFISNHAGTPLSDTSYEVTNLLPGETVEFEITAFGSGPCGNSSVQSSCTALECPIVTLAIDPVGDICRTGTTSPFSLTATLTGDTPNGVLIWSGPGVDASGLFDPAQANLGANTIDLTYTESNCIYSESITINVFETPAADFTADALVCTGDIVTVNYSGTDNPNQTYFWNFDGGDTPDGTGPGPHNVSWTMNGTYTITLFVENTNGCVSETTSMDVTVEPLLQTPTLDCSSTTNSIVFSWASVPGVTDSTINVSPLQNGVLQGNTYTLNGLPPSTSVDFELTLMGAGACPPVVVATTCATLDCPPISVDIDEPASFCFGTSPPLQMSAAVNGSSGTGTGIWSGTGVNASGMFDPDVAGVGEHLIKYTFEEIGCEFEDSVTINVYQIPVANFLVDNIICVADAATVAFSGAASPAANFTWDFDGGIAFPGTGPGPHQVSWDTPGDKTITLTVSNGGCSSGQFSQQVQVDQELSTPSIFCSPTTSSIELSWTAVSGATGYEIEILNQPPTTQTTTDLTYTVNNLAAGEEIVFQVTPVGNTSCPAQPAVSTCSTVPCSGIEVEIVPVAAICFTPTSEQVALQAVVSGQPNLGTATWSGQGVVDALLGIFDPLVAGVGLHLITHEYQIDNCIYTNEIEIKVAPPPTADAGEDASITCWESELSVRLGGDSTSTGPNVVFEWTTDTGDLPDNTNILRPEVTEPGTYTLTVTDLELGCSSTDEVVVTSAQDIPELSISFSSPDCSGQNTTLYIDAVDGGIGPFLFSLNDEPFVDTDTFPFLLPGNYSLAVIDAVGCENETVFEVEATGGLLVDLTANLVGRNYIEEGESIQLLTVLSIPEDLIDSVTWSNPELLSCSGCLNPMASPTEKTTFTVTVYLNGCSVSDELTINVEYNNAVYVPNAFSPNGDNVNDVFQLYPGPRVSKINSFKVFDRWGEMVASYDDYLPGDLDKGWDGTLDGKEMNPGVFVWFAEVEFVDGAKKMLKGEVVLVR